MKAGAAAIWPLKFSALLFHNLPQRGVAASDTASLLPLSPGVSGRFLECIHTSLSFPTGAKRKLSGSPMGGGERVRVAMVGTILAPASNEFNRAPNKGCDPKDPRAEWRRQQPGRRAAEHLSISCLIGWMRNICIRWLSNALCVRPVCYICMVSGEARERDEVVGVW